MEDSVTYRAVREEGEILGVRRTLLRLGRQRFGSPRGAIETALAGITDLGRLQRLCDRLLQVNTWEELLGTP